MKSFKIWMLVVILAGSTLMLGQSEPNLTNGFTPFGSYHGSGIDSVNLMNGNLITHIPFPQHYPQRGGRLNSEFGLIMNSKTWTIGTRPTDQTWGWMSNPLAPGPWPGSSLSSMFVRTYESDTSGGSSQVTTYSDYGYGIITSDGRLIGGTPETSITPDSGWAMNTANPDFNGTPQGGVVFDSAGNQYPIANWSGGCHTTTENDLQGAARTTICDQSILPASATDANGNVYTFFNGTPYDRDTLGRSIDGYSFGPIQGFNTTSDYSGCVSPLSISAATLSNYPAANGATNQIKTCYSTVSLQTAFNIAGASEWTGSTTLPVTIIYADGSKLSLAYDSYGNVTFIGLPLGGSISYQWTTVAFPALNIPVSRAVSQRTITDNNGHSYLWKYQWMTQQVNPGSINGTYTNVVTDPLGNDSVHVFTNFGWIAGFYETSTLYYQGSSTSGQLLKRTDTGYLAPVSGVSPPNVTNSISSGHCWPISVQTTVYPSGKVSLVKNTYDSVGFAKVVTEKEYDWGQGAPGPLLRETDTTYQWQVNTAYLNAHLINLPASVVVKDGNGNKLAETDYTYDESAYLQTYTGALPTGTHVAPPNPSPVRGNLTTVSRWLNTGGTVVTHSNWYDTGEVYQQIDPLGHTTTHSYDPAYAGAYSTKTCSPQTGTIAHCVSGTYDFNTGLLTSFTNENATTQASGNTPGDAAHTSTYAYDFLSRMTSATAPPDPNNGNARAQTTFVYSAANVFPFTVTRTKPITSSLTDSATSTYDGLGRVYKTQHPLPNGTAEVDTGYDGLDRAVSVTNPYFSTSDPTYGVTQSAYDALGRVTQTTKQDGSLATVSYTDNCTVATDEAGKQRRACSDGLGRLIEVDEPNFNAPATPATGNVTVSGSLLSKSGVGAVGATSATTQVTISGTDHSITLPGHQQCTTGPHPTCTFIPGGTLYDSGSVTLTVNGTPYSANFGQSSSAYSVAQGIASQMANDANVTVLSVSNSAVINLQARNAGSAGNNIILATSYTYNSSQFSSQGPSFTASPVSGNLSGGTDSYPGVTVYDQGTVTATIGSFSASAAYSQTGNSTAAQVALALAGTGPTGLNRDGSPVSATASGAGITLTYNTAGAAGNGLAVTVSSQSTQTQWTFSPSSFSGAGTTLSGGLNGGDLGNNPYVTQYQYDALGNLLRVDQKGSAPTDSSQWRTRTFAYNSLSQLLTANNPESGNISYAYDNAGNMLQKTSPAANQTGSATQTISFCYDALHRVIGRAYAAQSCPLNTPAVSYTYDVGANGIGHMASLTDQAGSGSYSYDVLGRISSEQRTIAGVSKNLGYSYNLDGSVKTVTYPSGAAVTYTPDSAGRMLSAVDSTNNINYVTSATYGPDSGITGFVSGNSGSFAGINNVFNYNNRLQPVNMSASAPGQTVFSIGYDFHLGNGNNGNVWGITNYKDNSRNQSFTYDALNRLTSAQNAGTNCAATTVNGKTEYWGNSYSYDAWGNLLGKSVTKCSAENLVLTAATNNQLVGYGYDAAGNMTSDPTDGVTSVYDAENRIATATKSGVTTAYTYDDDGNRVNKTNGSTGTLYWYMTLGIVGESDLTGTMKSEYVFFDGERVARKDFPSNAVSYYFSDDLKTASVITDSAGNIKSESDYYPWGGELQFTNNDSNHYKLGGHERDNETGLDYFGARYYSNGLGRFITPDWAARPAAVPYAVLGDPQTLNLYAYVGGNPASKTDPDGHCPFCPAGLALAGGGVLAEEAPLAFTGPVGWTVIGVTALGVAGYAAYQHFHNNPSPPPSVPVTHTPTTAPGSTATTTQTGVPASTTTTTQTGTPASTSQAGTVSTSTTQTTGNTGTVYVVPGTGTKSGRPYVGRHNKPNPAQTRRSNDGRDRSQAKVVQTYPAEDTQAGRVAEQQEIDKRGGVDKLDNKRNEIAPKEQK